VAEIDCGVHQSIDRVVPQIMKQLLYSASFPMHY